MKLMKIKLEILVHIVGYILFYLIGQQAIAMWTGH